MKIATAQFENRSGDKQYNLSVIEKLCRQASEAGADVVAFHECSVTGYSFARHLSRDQLLDRVWGNERTVTPRSVDVYIRRIREKIETAPQNPSFVQTVHGVGYRFMSSEED